MFVAGLDEHRPAALRGPGQRDLVQLGDLLLQPRHALLQRRRIAQVGGGEAVVERRSDALERRAPGVVVGLGESRTRLGHHEQGERADREHDQQRDTGTQAARGMES